MSTFILCLGLITLRKHFWLRRLVGQKNRSRPRNSFTTFNNSTVWRCFRQFTGNGIYIWIYNGVSRIYRSHISSNNSHKASITLLVIGARYGISSSKYGQRCAVVDIVLYAMSCFFSKLLYTQNENPYSPTINSPSLIARFMGPTWGPSGADRTRWAPCWPHELCYLGSHTLYHSCPSEELR